MEINLDTLEIEIVGTEPIDGGVQVFARAWSDGVQIGFGKDGTVDIERFRIFNPPVLIDDPNRDISSEWLSSDNIPQKRLLREDVQSALLESLAHTICLVGKDGTSIQPGKIGNTTSTFYPASGASSPCDGSAYEARYSNWTTTRNSLSAYSGGATGAVLELRNNVGNGFGASYFNIIRGFFLFDTSSIPDTDDISSATFSVYGDAPTTVITGSEQRLYVVSSNPASTSNIVVDDYDQVGASSFGETGSTYLTGAYNNVTLNSSGLSNISKTSISKFGLRGYYDYANVAPTDGASEFQIGFYLADEAGTTKDPKLVVEHSAGGGANTTDFFLMM